MSKRDRLDTLVRVYSDQLLEHLQKNKATGPRTYGFEYEFLSDFPLNLKQMDILYRFLPDIGFKKEEGCYRASSGVYITFEPGGQIEYHSTPMLPEDEDLLNNQIEIIETSNQEIHNRLGIKYIATDYLPNRADAPLCLTTERYRNLQDRLAHSGTRGLEMMKGTASIHLHVVIRSIDELAPLVSTLSRMSGDDVFKMGEERRDIWNNTDSSRCGLPSGYVENQNDPEKVVEDMVRFTLNAFDIGRKKLFYETEENAFDTFLYHMTTIFTDVRLNNKGPTFELRTLDSMPFKDFRKKWNLFTEQLENV